MATTILHGEPYPAYFDTAHAKDNMSEDWSSFATLSSLTELKSEYNTFDFASIHPSHGMSVVTGAFLDPSDDQASSEAQKILAAMAACGDDDDIFEQPSLEYGHSWSSQSSLDTPLTATTDASVQSLEYEPSTSSSFSLNNSTASMSLERTSSCFFEPPSVEHHTKDCSVPLDHDLFRRLSTPATPAVPIPSSEQLKHISSVAISFSLAPTQSTSSFMMRSYSAPVQTQMEHDMLRQKWNAEAQHAAASTQAGPSSDRNAYRPKIARRNTSASIPATRRQRDADDEGESSVSRRSSIHDTFSSHSHLLSPAYKQNPFKRSRMSFTSIREVDDTFSEVGSPPKAASPERVLSPPPKSPTRPSLNRFFTTPEFYLGGSNEDDSDEGAH